MILKDLKYFKGNQLNWLPTFEHLLNSIYSSNKLDTIFLIFFYLSKSSTPDAMVPIRFSGSLKNEFIYFFSGPSPRLTLTLTVWTRGNNQLLFQILLLASVLSNLKESDPMHHQLVELEVNLQVHEDDYKAELCPVNELFLHHW